MRSVPVRSGGKRVRMADGKVGVLYDAAPEADAAPLSITDLRAACSTRPAVLTPL